MARLLRCDPRTWLVGGLTLALAGPGLVQGQVRPVVAQAGPLTVQEAPLSVVAQAGPILVQAPEAEKIPAPEPVPAAAASSVLTLADCLRIAWEKQPSLSAQRASLAAAQTGLRSLHHLRAPAVVASPDLPIRRQQACLGVEIAEANLRQAELELAHNVTRLYFTVQYARAQAQVAREVAGEFRFYRDEVSKGVKEGTGPREWNQGTVDKLTMYLQMAEGRRVEAELGAERALGALRELLGMCPGAPLDIPDGPLPEPKVEVHSSEIVALALARRPEIVQVCKAQMVFELEVEAQGRTLLPGKVETFAAASDIHAKLIPVPSTQGEYRPGALGPEMPTLLVGRRSDRMERARDFAIRASAVTEKTRHLIALEAEDTFLQWQRARDRVHALREARDAGVRLATDTRKDFGGAQKVKIEDMLANEVLSAQARSQFNEALLNYLVSLAALERVTAGGFCAGFSPK